MKLWRYGTTLGEIYAYFHRAFTETAMYVGASRQIPHTVFLLGDLDFIQM